MGAAVRRTDVMVNPFQYEPEFYNRLKVTFRSALHSDRELERLMT